MEVIIPDTNMAAIMPQVLLTLGAALVLLLSVFFHGTRKWLSYLSFLTCAAAFVSLITLWHTDARIFSGMLTIDGYTNAFSAIILVCVGMICLITHGGVDEQKTGEFYSVVLLSTLGMIIMASTQNLMVIFLGLEIMSIGLYILIGLNRARVRALEAGLKYFLLGAFASGFFLYGIALTYGATGSFDLVRITQYIKMNSLLGDPLMLVGTGLLLIGFGFKVALIPFHMWTPDVYQGAPAPITAFIATGPKAAAFAAFGRVFMVALADLHFDWSTVVFWICVITIIGGNLLALIQQDIKRMLAFSSIAHAGYIIMSILAGPVLAEKNPDWASSALIFYVVVYALTNVIAFSVIYIFENREGRNLKVEHFAGFGFRYPMLSIAMSVAMLSMAGFPLTGGFIGKLQVFSAAVDAGYVGLTVIAVMMSVVSVYYYLGVIVKMFFTEAEVTLEDVAVPRATWFTILASTLVVVLLGIMPATMTELFKSLV